MGLDMHLEGEKFLLTDFRNPDNVPLEDGYRLKTKIVELGYGRKHPNLHGYIVNTFAGGVDDCERIALEPMDSRTSSMRLPRDNLPHTEDFFFGASDGPPRKRAI